MRFNNYTRRLTDTLIIHIGKVKAKKLMKSYDSEKIFDFKSHCQKRLIASVTTIPYRLNYSYYSIVSIMKQTIKPERILLVLDEKQKEKYIFPEKFKKLVDSGLEIIYREDLKCHTKYYYAISENPDSVIITFDDDCMYEPELFEKLYNSYKKNPTSVSCMRARVLQYDSDGKIQSYNCWPKCGNNLADIPRNDIMATGVGGVLYPPHIFDKETFNKEKIKELSLGQDDIWLYFMEMRNGVKICKVRGKNQMYVDVPNTQAQALQKSNVSGYKNDQCIKNLFEHYKIF